MPCTEGESEYDFHCWLLDQTVWAHCSIWFAILASIVNTLRKKAAGGADMYPFLFPFALAFAITGGTIGLAFAPGRNKRRLQLSARILQIGNVVLVAKMLVLHYTMPINDLKLMVDSFVDGAWVPYMLISTGTGVFIRMQYDARGSGWPSAFLIFALLMALALTTCTRLAARHGAYAGWYAMPYSLGHALSFVAGGVGYDHVECAYMRPMFRRAMQSHPPSLPPLSPPGSSVDSLSPVPSWTTPPWTPPQSRPPSPPKPHYPNPPPEQQSFPPHRGQFIPLQLVHALPVHPAPFLAVAPLAMDSSGAPLQGFNVLHSPALSSSLHDDGSSESESEDAEPSESGGEDPVRPERPTPR